MGNGVVSSNVNWEQFQKLAQTGISVIISFQAIPRLGRAGFSHPNQEPEVLQVRALQDRTLKSFLGQPLPEDFEEDDGAGHGGV